MRTTLASAAASAALLFGLALPAPAQDPVPDTPPDSPPSIAEQIKQAKEKLDKIKEAEDAEKAKEAEEKAGTASFAEIEIAGSYSEGPVTEGLFDAATETLGELKDRIEAVVEDDDVQGLVLKLEGVSLGYGGLDEVHASIQKVRKAGKPVWAYLDDVATKDYMLAAGCDKVVMPESGTWMVLGMRSEITFYKGFFDMVDIQPDMLRVGAFKSAAEPYTRTEMSDEFRQEMNDLLGGFFDTLVARISQNRELSSEKVTELINTAPHNPPAALEAGLIDAIAYEDQIDDLILKEQGSDFEAVELLADYGEKKQEKDLSGLAGLMEVMNALSGKEKPKKAVKGDKIGIVYCNGAIVTGSSSVSLLDGQTMGSDTIVAAIDKLREDDSVKAVVLRVDSPGGSALASDLIWRAVERCKKEKPVVASMSNVAASGGYYISMGCDKIFAEPNTITGSIGVLGGKIGLEGALKKVGVTISVVQKGENAGLLSPFDSFSDSERKAMQQMLEQTYEMFTTKAANGRGMEVDALEKLARGRVYTGTQAKKLDLIDETGTFEDAIAAAKELAKLDLGKDYPTRELPKAGNPLEALLGPLGGLSAPEMQAARDAETARQLSRVADQVAPGLSQHLRRVSVMELLSRDPKLVVLPYHLDVK